MIKIKTEKKNLKANNVDELDIEISSPGIYTISVKPVNTWLSIYYNDNIMKYGKGHIRFGSVDGKYKLRIRYDKPEDIDYVLSAEEFK